MAPSTTKVNFKTYKAQYRLMRAIVAAHPEVRWNYKEIAACFGSDMTEYALNHRFRRLRAHVTIIREGLDQGLDMKDLAPIDDLPVTKDTIDMNNIARYFGQSTPDGIQFQFRSIKRDAEVLRENDGTCFPSTPSTMTTTTMASTTTPAATAAASWRRPPVVAAVSLPLPPPPPAVRRARRIIKRSSSDEDDDDDDEEHDADDDKAWSDEYTPSKRAKCVPLNVAAGRPAAANGKELSNSPASSVTPRVDDSYDGYGDGEI